MTGVEGALDFLAVGSAKSRTLNWSAGVAAVRHSHAWPWMGGVRRVAAKHTNSRSKF